MGERQPRLRPRGSVMRRVAACLLIAVAALAAACARRSGEQAGRPVAHVGVILGAGGLGDRSFNDAAYEGLQKAQRTHGIRFEAVGHTGGPADLEEARRLVRLGYDLIVGIGYENAPCIATLARENPDRHFAMIDVRVDEPNVASVVFREAEGDFVMGALAAMLTRTGVVAFVGGADIDVIRRIESGFRQGVVHQDPAVELVAAFAGSFADPEAGLALATHLYASGVDVIYNAAGRTGLGIIEAARREDRLVIGTSVTWRRVTSWATGRNVWTSRSCGLSRKPFEGSSEAGCTSWASPTEVSRSGRSTRSWSPRGCAALCGVWSGT